MDKWNEQLRKQAAEVLEGIALLMDDAERYQESNNMPVALDRTYNEKDRNPEGRWGYSAISARAHMLRALSTANAIAPGPFIDLTTGIRNHLDEELWVLGCDAVKGLMFLLQEAEKDTPSKYTKGSRMLLGDLYTLVDDKRRGT